MMFDATELCRQLGIQRTALEAWIEAGWLRPVRAQNDWRFSTIDLVRAQFILDLRDPMGVNDEGVAVMFRKPRLARASRRIRGLRFENPPSDRAQRPGRRVRPRGSVADRARRI